ncbi:hypothetical protein ACFP1Z_29805 [Streptomyces gamaensis]|uniref:Uncharacterized protein n=1 Tax=Streptomyces gamaensis TaxID=1763542 RepID=A0ABW0Z919_9ACTN
MAVRTATPVTGWLLRGSDGRLTAYAPTEGGIARWTEARPGGPEWTGPELLPAPDLEPYLSIAQEPQGYVRLVGVRRRSADERTDTDVVTEVVYATQFQSGRPLTHWRSIGTPHHADWERAHQIGVPEAVCDSVGLQVFVRNAGGGVCARRQDARGLWGPWTDLKGSHVLDSLSSGVTSDGRVELLAPASEFVLRWRQDEPGGPLQRARNIPAKPAACSSTSVPTADDRITHFWRDTTDSALHVLRREAADDPDGHDGPGAGVVGGTGSGPVAALRATVDGRDCVVLAQRSTSGLPAVAVCPAGDDPSDVHWSETGEEFASQSAPALALDASGRVVLAVIGEDGRLWVARQTRAEKGFALGEWGRV